MKIGNKILIIVIAVIGLYATFLIASDITTVYDKISDFKIFNSAEVSSRTELSLLICLLIPPRF